MEAHDYYLSGACSEEITPRYGDVLLWRQSGLPVVWLNYRHTVQHDVNKFGDGTPLVLGVF